MRPLKSSEEGFICQFYGREQAYKRMLWVERTSVTTLAWRERKKGERRGVRNVCSWS